MTSRQRYREIAEIYHRVVELAPPERKTFLEQSCAGDSQLRNEVEELVAADAQAFPGFIETPALNLVAHKLAIKKLQFQERTLGHYRLLSLLGSGGMGEVYLAEDLNLRRKVAVKMLPEHMSQDSDGLRRFEMEAKMASRLTPTRPSRSLRAGNQSAAKVVESAHISLIFRQIEPLFTSKSGKSGLEGLAEGSGLPLNRILYRCPRIPGQWPPEERSRYDLRF